MDPLRLGEHADRPRPLGGYLVLIAGLNGSVAAGLAAAGRRGRLPERLAAGDLALLTAATYQLSRLISRDRVSAGLRAPFTRFQGDAGRGEVDEAARGRGMRRAVGELLVCPHCVGTWVAAGFVLGHLHAPRATRAAAAIATVDALADVLQDARGRLD